MSKTFPAGTTVHLPVRRIPYVVNRGTGYSNPDWRQRWDCPVGCGFSIEDRDAKLVQRAADEHHCDAGWSAVPMTGARIGISGLGRDALEPTNEDRTRWAEQREAKAKRRAASRK